MLVSHKAFQIELSYDKFFYIDPNGLTSHVSPNNKLVIEVPIRKPPADRRLEPARNDHQSLTQFDQYRDPLLNNAGSLDNSNLQPRIVNKGNNQKQLEVTVGVKNYRPEELQVLVKNNELIVQGEHQHKDDNRSERSFFFKSTTLPPGTQIEQLQAHLNDDGQLRIEGPVL
jgi:HSP20 family molecular chaperone IbpA